MLPTNECLVLVYAKPPCQKGWQAAIFVLFCFLFLFLPVLVLDCCKCSVWPGFDVFLNYIQQPGLVVSCLKQLVRYRLSWFAKTNKICTIVLQLNSLRETNASRSTRKIVIPRFHLLLETEHEWRIHVDIIKRNNQYWIGVYYALGFWQPSRFLCAFAPLGDLSSFAVNIRQGTLGALIRKHSTHHQLIKAEINNNAWKHLLPPSLHSIHSIVLDYYFD